jgi:hypothetical protein
MGPTKVSRDLKNLSIENSISVMKISRTPMVSKRTLRRGKEL